MRYKFYQTYLCIDECSQDSKQTDLLTCQLAVNSHTCLLALVTFLYVNDISGTPGSIKPQLVTNCKHIQNSKVLKLFII